MVRSTLKARERRAPRRRRSPHTLRFFPFGFVGLLSPVLVSSIRIQDKQADNSAAAAAVWRLPLLLTSPCVEVFYVCFRCMYIVGVGLRVFVMCKNGRMLLLWGLLLWYGVRERSRLWTIFWGRSIRFALISLKNLPHHLGAAGVAARTHILFNLANP